MPIRRRSDVIASDRILLAAFGDELRVEPRSASRQKSSPAVLLAVHRRVSTRCGIRSHGGGAFHWRRPEPREAQGDIADGCSGCGVSPQ
jgi:hypothetical protein